MKAPLPHVVVTKSVASTTVIDLVEVTIGNHYESHSLAMRIIKRLPQSGTFVAGRIKRGLNFDNEPRLIPAIM